VRAKTWAALATRTADPRGTTQTRASADQLHALAEAHDALRELHQPHNDQLASPGGRAALVRQVDAAN
jgi:hypothetical protein